MFFSPGPCVNYSGCQITWAKFCKVCVSVARSLSLSVCLFVSLSLSHMVFHLTCQLPGYCVALMFFSPLLFSGKHGWQRLLLLGVAGQHHRPGEEVHPGAVERGVRGRLAPCIVLESSVPKLFRLLFWRPCSLFTPASCGCLQLHHGLHQQGEGEGAPQPQTSRNLPAALQREQQGGRHHLHVGRERHQR